MTPEEFDDLVYQIGLKPAEASAFIKAGLQRLAQPASKAPVPEPEVFDGEAHIAGLDPELQARLERNQRLAAVRLLGPEVGVGCPERLGGVGGGVA